MSISALANKLAELEERYQGLMDRMHSEHLHTEVSRSLAPTISIDSGIPQNTYRHTQALDPETSLQLKADALDDPWLLKTMGRTSRNVMYDS